MTFFKPKNRICLHNVRWWQLTTINFHWNTQMSFWSFETKKVEHVSTIWWMVNFLTTTRHHSKHANASLFNRCLRVRKHSFMAFLQQTEIIPCKLQKIGAIIFPADCWILNFFMTGLYVALLWLLIQDNKNEPISHSVTSACLSLQSSKIWIYNDMKLSIRHFSKI